MDYKEEAEKIVVPFYGYTTTKASAIRCAIIHVNGIIMQLEMADTICGHEEYWSSVLEELKLMENEHN